MEELTITVENKDYVVQLQETKGQMLYVVKAGDADVVFAANDFGDIVPRDEANPTELLQQIGRAIEQALA